MLRLQKSWIQLSRVPYGFPSKALASAVCDFVNSKSLLILSC